MKYIATAAGGAVLGALIVLLVLWQQMPAQMITVHESPYDLEETVRVIEARVQDAGWKMPKVYDLQKSLEQEGLAVPGIRVFSLCSPPHAHRLLSRDETRFVSAMMPCRIAVYEHEGATHIASMNVELMSSLFGGEISTVMRTVSEEQKDMLGALLAREID